MKEKSFTVVKVFRDRSSIIAEWTEYRLKKTDFYFQNIGKTTDIVVKHYINIICMRIWELFFFFFEFHDFWDFCFKTYSIYLFSTLFNVRQTIVIRLVKTNLTKTNTDILDKNLKIFRMQHKNSESFVHDSISVWIL